MDNLIFIESLGLDIRKEIAVILIRSCSCLKFFQRISHIPKHLDPSNRRNYIAEMEPMNSFDKYAVVAIRGGQVVGNLRELPGNLQIQFSIS